MIAAAALLVLLLGALTGALTYVLRSVLTAWEREREEWNRERAGLLQRIQAPAVAVADHSGAQHEPSENVPWLGWDEDPETLTKEELAELE